MNYSNLKPGMKVFFFGELQWLEIKAMDKNFAIATRPFNLKNTVIYSILDFKNGVKAPNSYTFNPYDYSKQKDINKCLRDLNSGKCELSKRRSALLRINWVKTMRRWERDN